MQGFKAFTKFAKLVSFLKKFLEIIYFRIQYFSQVWYDCKIFTPWIATINSLNRLANARLAKAAFHTAIVS